MSAFPPGLARELRRAATDGHRLLLALDFDGTLARLRLSPGEARLARARRRRLELLARAPRVRVLLISGRREDDLALRAPVAGAALSGEHGRTLRGLGAAWRHRKLDAWAATARRLAPAAARAVRRDAGVLVERKRGSVAVHYRASPRVRRNPGLLALKLAPLVPPGWVLVPGKALWEFKPRSRWDKGRAVLMALRRLGPGWKALFVGDDRTDEDGFRTVSGRAWTVKVGTDESAARWSTPGLAGVDSLLVEAFRRFGPASRPCAP